MKIAIDVHSVGAQAGGNESYFRQLIHGLVTAPGNHQYTLFYAHRAALQTTHGDGRFNFVPVPANPVRRLAISLPRALSKLQPDVFHCQYVQPLWGQQKTVVSIHDLAFEHFPGYFHPREAFRLKKTVRWTARHADHIVTLSEFSAADIAQRYGVSREKITITPLAASESFHPREKSECQAHLAQNYGITFPFILYVGRIQARKNLPRLVEAFATLRKQGATAKLVLVGKKDWQAEQLEARIKELGLEREVIFPGFVSFDDLPLFYNAAEMFVFPSFFEGFGLPVIESMASGIPTITSTGSSLGEVAGDGAILVDPNDSPALTDAMSRVLGSADLRKDLIARGLRRSAQFRHDELARKVLEVYASLA